jgi:MFS family permease
VVGSVVQFVVIPAIGALSDRIGRRPLYLAGAIGVAAWSFVFFDLIASRSQPKIILAVVVGLVLHALMYSPQAAFFAELFGTSVRYTGASVGYQLASILAGALAPIIALKLLGTVEESNTGAVAAYMTIASLITVVAVIAARETSKSSLRHDR